jgi:hypothetical protein
MRCAMCGRKSETVTCPSGAKYSVFECGGDAQGAGSLKWYSDTKGQGEYLDLCYRCAEKLAEIIKRRRWG